MRACVLRAGVCARACVRACVRASEHTCKRNIRLDACALAQEGFGFFFLAEFIVRLYAAESPTSHLKKTLTLIDIFTIFPPYVGMLLQV